MATIAYLGTGLLGSGFVEAALNRGDHVAVWNRTRAKAEVLSAFGARIADTPAEAVHGAERVHLVLKDDAVVDDVMGALRPGLAPGAVVIDHSTTLPALTAERSQRLAADGVAFLHAPVFIGPAAARKGQGSILVSGPATVYAQVERALSAQAETVRYLGERPDLAAAHKLIGNAFLIGLGGLIADVLTIGAGCAVAPDEALQLLELFNPANVVRNRGAKMSQGDFTASFELVMARKDIRLMMEAAGARPLAMLPSLAARMDEVIAQGHGADDFGVIARDALAERGRGR